jgi:hypothetical protein
VFSYEVDGSILILRASGTTTLSERQRVFNAVRADAAVPSDALLLLDVREVDVREGDLAMSEYTGVERLRVGRSTRAEIGTGLCGDCLPRTC